MTTTITSSFQSLSKQAEAAAAAKKMRLPTSSTTTTSNNNNNNASTTTKLQHQHGFDGSKLTELELLSENYIPGVYDVICGCKGKSFQAYNHSGNKYYRTMIDNHVQQYLIAKQDNKTKIEKSLIITSIVNAIYSRQGGFIQKDITTQRWYRFKGYAAREKVSKR